MKIAVIAENTTNIIIPDRPDIIRNSLDIQSLKIRAQGLAGGVVGSILGYKIGNGTWTGAAAGSYLGNGTA